MLKNTFSIIKNKISLNKYSSFNFSINNINLKFNNKNLTNKFSNNSVYKNIKFNFCNLNNNEKNAINTLSKYINNIRYKDNKDLNVDIDLNESNILNNIKIDIEKKKIIIYFNLHKKHRSISEYVLADLNNNFCRLGIDEFKDYDKIIKLAPIERSKNLTSDSSIDSKIAIKKNLSKVKHIIAVSSCKGGVGKSTIAINIATSLNKIHKSLNIKDINSKKLKVGIFDADIHGPSLPVLLNTFQRQAYTSPDDASIISPIMFNDIKLMSYGFAAPNKKAVVRGPIVSSIVNQLILSTDWGELDYLIVDFPPGTGDIQLSLCQEVNFTGAIIVTTPQKLSFIDVVKGIEMFDDMKIPIISVVENMSYFKCNNCDEEHRLFGKGYISMLKTQFGIEDSYELPLEKKISQCGDVGNPFSLTFDKREKIEYFKDINKYIVSTTDENGMSKINENYTNSFNVEVKKELHNNISNKTKTSNSKLTVDIALNVFNKMAIDLDKKLNSEDNKFLENIKQVPSVVYSKESNSFNIYEDKNKLIKSINSKYLRSKCICAACINEYTGENLINEKLIPANVYPKLIENRGNYAVSVVWSDGHKSSIYPYKRLLSDDIKGI